MIKIGNINNLKIIKTVDFGVYLDGENEGEILLPKRYVPENSKIDDMVDVFIYFDSENRIIATTEIPKAMAYECAFLPVVSINESIGAFLDWGLPKDLLVPLSEQRESMQPNKSYVVYIYIEDRTNRIVASTKINKHLNKKINFKEDDPVDLLIFEETEIGFNATINNSNVGLLYKNEIFQNITVGQKIKGFIKKIRLDEKIDLCLTKPNYSNYQDIPLNSEKILDYLKAQDGFANIGDKTPPETIYKIFGISKKVFKDALGYLYRNKIIKIEKDGIRIVVETP